jgi:valyl-tRNA synthetase
MPDAPKPSLQDLETRTRYEPGEAEPRVRDRWLESGIFHPEPEGTAAENFSIAVPPPNVTGALHMGHALNGSVQDTLARYHRMHGRRVKWIFGTDHAGIATQKQVEKRLIEEGTSREELGREAFTERVWQWREQYGSTIKEQFQALGASLDYDDERFTLDDSYVEAVLKVFVELYEQGLIYRDNYMVNWDPGSRSAISDLEVEDRDVTDTLVRIAYPLASGEGEVVIATVRPETMLGDVAVAVHPEDPRYQDLLGQEVILPIVGRRLRIIADPYVKPEFGTGALKITPGHDPNDFEIGRRHGLPEISVIGEDGRMTAAAGEPFAGMTVMEAREAVLERLRADGLVRGEEFYPHVVPYSHRSGERIEPLISLQWFMDMEQLAAPAIDVVRNERVKFTPERWGGVYLDWLENIRPWCISRQLWWGHRLPVWYCDPCEETIVSTEPPERCGKCGGELRRDEDVLDTWFSSALWPFATLGWPHETPELRAFYPTDVLVTGRDIIFLWVARMVMMGLRFPGDIPFSDVFITSIIQAPDGRRMSKSLGTGIDPLDEIAKHGADGTRFGLLAMSSSQDVRYSAEKVAQGQQLANKLWNASRLILLRADAEAVGAPPSTTAIEDRWILSRLEHAKRTTIRNIETFDFAHAALDLYAFVYGELCDWYLELVKPRLYEEGPARTEASATLLHVLRETLALAHPVIPFVTEEIWSYVPGTEGLLAASPYPHVDVERNDHAAEAELGATIGAVQALRAWRETVGLRPGVEVPARLAADGYDEAARAHVARLARVSLDGAEGEAVATVPIPGGAVEVLPAEGIDPAEAQAKRDAEAQRLRTEIARAEGKLANEGFVAKAPEAVVEAERAKLDRLRAELERL